MSFIHSLRALVDLQQFSALKEQAQQYLFETRDIQVLPLLALSHALLGERDKAMATCLQAESQLMHLELDAQVDLAGAYCQLHRVDDALTLLEVVQDEVPEHPLMLARLAWCRAVSGKTDSAITLYEQSIHLAPERLPVWNALISLYLQSENYAQAQQALNDGITQFELISAQLPEQAITKFTQQFRHFQLTLWVVSETISAAEQWLDSRREDLSEDEWVSLQVHYAILLSGQDNHSNADESLRAALKHYPRNQQLISQLAELALMQGRSMQAVQLLRRLIRLAKEEELPDVSYWLRLSNACLHSMPEQARKAADKAMEQVDALTVNELTPEPMIKQLRLQAKSALAHVESQAQNFALAEALFNELLDESPHFLPALQGLGQQQMQQGDIDKALALFERIKEIDPAKGYSALINARQFPEDEQVLERMEKSARQPSIEGSMRYSLLLQVATAREKRKEFDAAFKLAVEANSAGKKRLGYDPKAHRNQCARLRDVFSKPLFEHRKGCGVDATLPIFVVGMPRSGTTLVEQILAGHSKIFGAGELGVIPSRIQGLNRWERHVGSKRTYPDCIDDMSIDVSKGIANGVLDELRELAAEDKPEAMHVVDKLPHNFESIGLIKFLFPNARIISVRRDPRDIALSNFFTDYQAKHGGMGFAYDLTWIGEQLSDHNMMMHHWEQVFPGEILQVNYEDVVDDLAGSAKRMLDYIGVNWEDQVLSFNELARPVKTASVWQVRQPIYKTSKAKWKRYQDHLAPLVKGTNAKIIVDPMTDRVVLPVAGFLQEGVALFKEDKLDEAEMCLKKMLHHNPEHAACNYMVGLIYCRKGHVDDAIEFFEKALETCPWQKEWRDNLIKAYQQLGENGKALALNNGVAVEQDKDEEVFYFLGDTSQ